VGVALDQKKWEHVARRAIPQGRLLRAWPLAGGVSAQVTALEIALPDGAVIKAVVRQHGGVDLARNPEIAADEFHLLQTLHAAGLPVPAPYHLDRSGEILSTPYLVLEYVEGQTVFEPDNLDGYLGQLAAVLAAIHRVTVPDRASFPPHLGCGFGAYPATPDHSLDEGRVREALEAAWPLQTLNDEVLLHGDFWPGNVLWQDGRIAAVIDWEDVRWGDPLADVGNARLEILWAFGPEAMRCFTKAYGEIATTVDFAHLAYWDLCAALRPAGKLAGWRLGEAREHEMRDKHKWFVEQALM